MALVLLYHPRSERPPDTSPDVLQDLQVNACSLRAAPRDQQAFRQGLAMPQQLGMLQHHGDSTPLSQGLVLIGWCLECTRCNRLVHVAHQFPCNAHAVLHVHDPLVGGTVWGVLHIAGAHLKDGPDPALCCLFISVLRGVTVVLKSIAEDVPSQQRGHRCLSSRLALQHHHRRAAPSQPCQGILQLDRPVPGLELHEGHLQPAHQVGEGQLGEPHDAAGLGAAQHTQRLRLVTAAPRVHGFRLVVSKHADGDALVHLPNELQLDHHRYRLWECVPHCLRLAIQRGCVDVRQQGMALGLQQAPTLADLLQQDRRVREQVLHDV
mmetsp:Transcript_19708/g.35056  ORF Transcript_19708/g.35056 Transcript_19708/m.35056 type:complete len:322 (-) Transcript_19708:2704-3669(-)